jgi:uncharacterized protein
MPVQPSYPGIYIEELPSSTHTITAAPTSIAVFIGYTHPFRTKTFNKPIELFSFNDYVTWFGGFFKSAFFDAEAPLFGDVAQAVNQFFLNGGAQAYVVGLLPQVLTASPSPGQPVPTAIQPPGRAFGPLTFTPLQLIDPPLNAAAPLYLGPDYVMQITISNVAATYPSTAFSSPPANLTIPYSFSLPYSSPSDDTADITITYGAPSTSPLAGFGTIAEVYRQVSLNPFSPNGKPNPNYILTRINGVSALVTVAITVPGPLVSSGGPQSLPPTLSVLPWPGFPSSSSTKLTAPVIFQQNDFTNVFQQDSPLDKLSIFNLLVIPGVTDNLLGSVLSTATAFCERK